MYAKIKEILKNVRILIVDDDENLLDALKQALSGYVSEIFTALNSKNAIEIFTQKSPNLILTDINMPKISGLEMAKIIRQSDKNVPILFLTAYDSDENIFKAIDIKSVGVLKKPCEKRDLIMKISFIANSFQSDFASINLGNGFTFNAFSKELFNNGNSVSLTKKEREILHLFLKNQNRVVTFEMLENYVWYNESCTADTIRSFVYKLRKKLYAELILNAQGLGYKLNLQHENLRTQNEIRYI